ncbi:hypothetical protein F5878DRAFT_712256 [Lentinula raphanica]|uniref:Secreted protein n=1 Tax=Lentinula raphanica TaxID=153919 RepID=A0AA38P325_9AGAR|nr:hypothetical protein F5878DRAFT_712256 [Lentinula raphanica]
MRFNRISVLLCCFAAVYCVPMGSLMSTLSEKPEESGQEQPQTSKWKSVFKKPGWWCTYPKYKLDEDGCPLFRDYRSGEETESLRTSIIYIEFPQNEVPGKKDWRWPSAPASISHRIHLALWNKYRKTPTFANFVKANQKGLPIKYINRYKGDPNAKTFRVRYYTDIFALVTEMQADLKVDFGCTEERRHSTVSAWLTTSIPQQKVWKLKEHRKD